MQILTKVRKQKAIYWAALGTNSAGRKEYDDPVQIMVRWDDAMTEFVTQDGEKAVSRADVMVGQDIKVGDALMLGVLDDTITDNPMDHTGAGVVRGWAKTPTLNGRKALRVCYL